jgi:hypothetical protein
MPDLLAALRRVARSGRLGQPVFLRCHVTAPPERALTALAEALAAAAALFDDAPATLQAAGDKAAGSLHAVLIFRSGSTVVAYTGPGEEAADAMLLGNHGAAYGPGAALPDTRPSGPMIDPGEASVRRFTDWVRAALAEGAVLRLDA